MGHARKRKINRKRRGTRLRTIEKLQVDKDQLETAVVAVIRIPQDDGIVT